MKVSAYLGVLLIVVSLTHRCEAETAATDNSAVNPDASKPPGKPLVKKLVNGVVVGDVVKGVVVDDVVKGVVVDEVLNKLGKKPDIVPAVNSPIADPLATVSNATQAVVGAADSKIATKESSTLTSETLKSADSLTDVLDDLLKKVKVNVQKLKDSKPNPESPDPEAKKNLDEIAATVKEFLEKAGFEVSVAKATLVSNSADGKIATQESVSETPKSTDTSPESTADLFKKLKVIAQDLKTVKTTPGSPDPETKKKLDELAAIIKQLFGNLDVKGTEVTAAVVSDPAQVDVKVAA